MSERSGWAQYCVVILDCANALLHGTCAGIIHRLQVVQNSLARVICQDPLSASANELRQQLQFADISSINWQSSPIT